MAVTDAYTSAQRALVAAQLGPFLAALGEDGLYEVAESLQVWTVSRGQFLANGATTASWSRQWHHQLRQDDQLPGLFALSRDSGTPVVRAAYRSPLAEQVDRAITAIDADPDFQSDAFVVRLLEITGSSRTVVWIHGPVPPGQPRNDSFVLLDAPVPPEEPNLVPIPEANLAAVLAAVPPIIGLSEVPPPDRQPGF